MQVFFPFMIRYFSDGEEVFPEVVDWEGTSWDHENVQGGVLVLDIETIDRILLAMQRLEDIGAVEMARMRWNLATILVAGEPGSGELGGEEVDEYFEQLAQRSMFERHRVMDRALFPSRLETLIGEESALQRLLERRLRSVPEPTVSVSPDSLALGWSIWGGNAESWPMLSEEQLQELRSGLESGEITSSGTISMPRNPTH